MLLALSSAEGRAAPCNSITGSPLCGWGQHFLHHRLYWGAEWMEGGFRKVLLDLVLRTKEPLNLL